VSIEETRRITAEFLETLDKNGLIQFNSELWHNKFTKNFPYRTRLFTYVFHRILEQHDDKKLGIRLTDEAMSVFVFTSIVNFITSNLEFVKKLLHVLIDKNKITFPKNVTYGKLIGIISDKLRFDETQRQKIRNNFYVDFRNGISHIQYTVTKNGVSVDMDGQTIHFNNEQLNQIMDETSVIVNVFEEFGNKKTSELEDKDQELRNKEKELKQKWFEEASKIGETRKNVIQTRSKTARLNRKSDKLEKKLEIIDRKKAKKNKTTARIIPKSEPQFTFQYKNSDLADLDLNNNFKNL